MTIECSTCGYFWVEQDSKCPRCWYLTEEQKNNPALKRIVSDPEIAWDIDGNNHNGPLTSTAAAQ